MKTKNFISILASAALLVSCAPTTTPTTTAATAATHHPGKVKPYSSPTLMPSPSPTPSPGKRTETGTVIGLTSTQITLQTATGTWIIDRTDSRTKIKAGSLTLNATDVTIEFWVPPGSLLGA